MPDAVALRDRSRRVLAGAVTSRQVERAREVLGRFSDRDAIVVLEDAERAREERRLRTMPRGASGWKRGQPQCGGCRRLLSGRGQTCPNCGFTDGAGYPR